MTRDELYMQRCFDLARRAIGLTSPNPMVGCVIVHDDRIIGEGWHKKSGTPHAEINALASVSEEDQRLLGESTVYVSLEPCAHYGKTPPCCDALLEINPKRVVISVVDPNPQVAGKSVILLREAGIDVATGVLEKEGRWLLRRFATSMIEKRPYIILKYAQSADGFIGLSDKQIWLTSPISKRLVHRWRTEEDAFLVGSRTALLDDPALTSRLIEGRNPLRLVLDRRSIVPQTHQLFDGSTPTVVYTSASSNHQPSKHIELISVSNSQPIVDILHDLSTRGCLSLVVEGGAQLLNAFLEAGLWDEARVFTSLKSLHTGIEAPRQRGRRMTTEQIRSDRLETWINPANSFLRGD